MTLIALGSRVGAFAHAQHPSPEPALLRELTVADGASADIGDLLIQARTPVALVQPTEHAQVALAALSAALAGGALDVLHIVAHGRAGAFSLGGHWIDTRALAASAAQLTGWRVATIALWSCHAGQDDTLAHVLGALTGARVLATSGVLGMLANGARWQLVDTDGGEPPARFAAPFDPAMMERWPHRLAKRGFVNA